MQNVKDFEDFTFDNYLEDEENEYPGTIKKLETLTEVKIKQAQFIKDLMEIRKRKHISRKDVEKLTGIKQSEISKGVG